MYIVIAFLEYDYLVPTSASDGKGRYHIISYFSQDITFYGIILGTN